MIPRAKILIVEDDASQRFLYSEELKEEGYNPIVSKNGKEAMQFLRTVNLTSLCLTLSCQS